MALAWMELMAALKKTIKPVCVLDFPSRDPGVACVESVLLRSWICSLVTLRVIRMTYGVGLTVDAEGDRVGILCTGFYDPS